MIEEILINRLSAEHVRHNEKLQFIQKRSAWLKERFEDTKTKAKNNDDYYLMKGYDEEFRKSVYDESVREADEWFAQVINSDDVSPVIEEVLHLKNLADIKEVQSIVNENKMNKGNDEEDFSVDNFPLLVSSQASQKRKISQISGQNVQKEQNKKQATRSNQM